MLHTSNASMDAAQHSRGLRRTAAPGNKSSAMASPSDASFRTLLLSGQVADTKLNRLRSCKDQAPRLEKAALHCCSPWKTALSELLSEPRAF